VGGPGHFDLLGRARVRQFALPKTQSGLRHRRQLFGTGQRQVFNWWVSCLLHDLCVSTLADRQQLR
jgi:hypothetical protein